MQLACRFVCWWLWCLDQVRHERSGSACVHVITDQARPSSLVLTVPPLYAGGQGGGSFFIVIFSVLLGFTTNQAAALSAAVVFFG